MNRTSNTNNYLTCNRAMSKEQSTSFQQVQNSVNHHESINHLDQVNKLTYIDDDYQPTNPPFYADLKLNDNLQGVHIDQPTEPIKHWSKLIYKCMEIQLFEWNIAGGSDYGQLNSGDIILEIDGIKISGFTRLDVLNVIRSKQYHFIKAVSSNSLYDLPIDLKDYLSRRFVRNSEDYDLQSVIRDNVYARTVPCTTRPPKPNEVDGVDYKFISKSEFIEMDRSGVLLESGIYCGHYYGTPLPLSNSIQQFPIDFSNLCDTVDNMFTTNNRLNENNIINSINNSTMKKDLSPNQLARSTNNNLLQQSPNQLSGMALKRRRNRSNIVAIDASALPTGWEMIKDDHVHGIYYIDHINKRTQYERPYEVELTKGANGFGFTLSYLNSGLVVVKTIIKDGPASLCGIIQPSDFLVSVSNVSVNGLNHSDIAKLFSKFEIGDRVKLTFARSLQTFNEKVENSSIDNGEEFDLITVDICKGANGFGFTISDAINGQKVKKILDVERCGALRQGDLLTFVNNVDLSNLNHIEVVEVLKNHCQIGEETRFIVKRFKNLSNNKIQEEINSMQSETPNYSNTNDCVNYNKNGNLVPNFNEYDLQDAIYHMNYDQEQNEHQVNNKLNDNLIAELKANMARNNNLKNGVNSNHINSSPTSNQIINNNLSNTDLIDSNENNNLFNAVENNQNNSYVSNTKIIDDNQSINEDEFEYFRVFLNRSETNYSFGFRIVGGSEENRPVTIGSIVIGGVAWVDGILKSGDEIISINDQNVMNASHHYVVKLMSNCSNSVSLLVRRRKDSDAFDVILKRDPIADTFGFGFVIISCGNCALIGRIIDNSPASRCGRLKIRDKIIAVNNSNITQMNHPDIVNMIKESGLTLKLRIVPANCYTVELIRGPKGFGFSIRGGMEFNRMPLFILRILPDGPAFSLLNIGDEIIEINSIPTYNMTHADAVLLISNSGPSVKLKLRRCDMLNTTGISSFNATPQNTDSYTCE